MGANIGYFTTLLAKLVGKNGKVYSYEANKEVCDLAFFLTNEWVSDIAYVKNCAVSNKNGFIDFSYQKIHGGKRNDISLSHLKFAGDKTWTTAQVPCVRIDDDLPDLTNVDWLRMDIEGAEILALSGAKKIIESSPNLKIITEWDVNMMSHYRDVSKLIDDLHAAGFKFFRLPTMHYKLGQELTKHELLTSFFVNVLIIKNLEQYKQIKNQL